VLSDGSGEVPFVRDGSGGVVAHYTVERDAELHVAARFGSVLIREPEALGLRAAPDEVPSVSLGLRDPDGVLQPAPRALALGDRTSFELEWEARDDHGVRAVELVLRVGSREERRPLAQLHGGRDVERGAHALRAADPLLRRAFLPVVVRVEARDGDPLHGPKWGKSEAITLTPPAVGAAEATRHVALGEARAQLVDLLAARLGRAAATPPRAPAPRAPPTKSLADLRQQRTRAIATVRAELAAPHGGLGVPPRLRAFASGQLRRLERSDLSRPAGLRTLEDVVLALDVAVQALAVRDARSVARRLADVADEVAAAAGQERRGERASAPDFRRIDAALVALTAGSEQLSKLGSLGADLGGAASSALQRMRRARRARHVGHTELAALHLAARLRRPDASFAASARGGVESGGAENAEPSGPASEAEARFEQLADELQELIRDHAGEVGKSEQALAEAERDLDLDALRREGAEHAEAVRRAVEELPLGGGEPDSAHATASRARENAESMAHSLDQGQLEDAVESGRSAVEAAEQAARRSSEDGELDPETLKDALGKLRKELAWGERRLERLRRAAEARAKDALRDGADREKGHARRAANLASRGKLAESALPDDLVEALEQAERRMHEAARELGAGHGERGLQRQREAQRLLESLEQASDPRGNAEQGPSGGRGGSADPRERDGDGEDDRGGQKMRTDGDVPGASERTEAERFRRRVLDGLGRAREGRLGGALRRYADGLLR
jgi:hypothetical protein